MIEDNKSGLKSIAYENVLSSEETCDYLNISRQYLHNLVKNNKIKILKSIKGGTIFWKPDVLNFEAQRHADKLSQNHVILGGSTYRAEEAFDKLNLNPEEIDSIHIYIDERDAANDGYYNLKSIETYNTLVGIEAPRCIIRMLDNTEYWFEGFSVGSDSESCHGSERMLNKLGIIEIGKDRINRIISGSHILHVYNTVDGWDIQNSESLFVTLDVMSCDERLPVHTRLYHFNGKLVLINERENKRWKFERLEALPIEYIEKLFEFIPNVSIVQYMERERCFENGYYITTSQVTNIFQVVISDERNRELWMLYPDESIDNKELRTLQDILQGFGLRLDTKVASTTFKALLKKRIRLVIRQ